MELQLVTFEQAKVLKELGFPQEEELLYALTTVYDEYNQEHHEGDTCYAGDGYSAKEVVSASTLELVAKWLRDEKNISLEPYRTGCGWICMIVDIPSGTDKYQVGYDDDMGDDRASGQFTTFEKALSAGIDKAIEILK